jgi:phage FluMu gp28-like protein
MGARQRKQIAEPAKLAPIQAASEYRPHALLLPYQQRWVLDPSGYKICEKSRRVGITWGTAVMAVIRAARGVSDVWYILYNEDGAKEFIRDCEKMGKALNLFAAEAGEVVLEEDDEGEVRHIKAFQIVTPSGCRITALTSSPRNLRGKQGLVIIDEAAFHDDLAGLLKAAGAFRMWGGEVWVLSTHDGVDNPFNKLVEDVRDGKLPYSLHRITLEQALAEGLYKRICQTLGKVWSQEGQDEWERVLREEYGEDAAEELDVVPAKSGQAYIPRPLIDACMYAAPVVRFEQADDWCAIDEEERTRQVSEWLEAVMVPLLSAMPDDPTAFGWDFGRYSDLSVLAPAQVRRDLVKVVPWMLELKRIPFNQQWQILHFCIERFPRFTFGCLDAGGNGSYIAEQAWLRFGGDDHIERVQLSLNYYRDHMPALKKAHESKLLLYPRDIDVRNDVAAFRRINGVPKLPDLKKEDVGHGGKRHGDAAIALLLANSAASKAEDIMLRWEALSKI